MQTNITILCANRPRLFKQALDSIGNLNDATVTIRDAGINKQVRDVAYDWQSPRRHWFAATEPVGTGQARNAVIKESESHFGRGDYLYLSDDDVFFCRPDWLEVLIANYQTAQTCGFKVIGAYNHPYHLHGDKFTGVLGYTVCEVQALALQSMIMTWDIWDTYGPFGDTPVGRVCMGEDVDFGNKIKADGFRLGVIDPPLLVNCGITNSFGQPIPGSDAVKAQAPEGIICE